MRKVIRNILIVFLIVCTLIPKTVVVKAKDTGDYKKFSQMDDRWGAWDYQYQRETSKGADGTIGAWGCFITSITVLMAYADPNLRDVDKWNPKIASSKFSFSGYGLIPSSVKNVDGTFKHILDDDKRYSPDEALKKVKGYYDKGYYVVIRTSSSPITTSTHFSPIVGFDNGKPLVLDVANNVYSNWDTWAKAGIDNIDVFESTRSKSYDTMGKNSGSNFGGDINLSDKEREEKLKVLDEWNLKGMPKNLQLSATADNINLPDYDSLSKLEKQNLESIKVGIDDRKDSWFDKARFGVSFIGLVMLLYGVLLGLAYLFDKSNAIIEISLLSILTLGKYKIWSEDLGIDEGRDSRGNVFYCTGKSILIRIVVIEIIGFFLISSGLFNILYSLLII